MRTKLKNKIVLLVIVILALFILVYSQKTGFFIFQDADNVKMIELANPVVGLTDEEAVRQFDSSFILYFLYSVNAHTLRSTILSRDSPKIEMHIGGEVFSSEIKKGEIFIAEGEIEGEDVTITTTKEEAVKMIRDKSNIRNSIVEGKTQIEFVAGKTELISKGYVSLYNSFTDGMRSK